MQSILLRASAACLAAGLLVESAAAENWPGWRGPRGDGTSTEENLPLRWSATENVAWKVPLACEGHASPAVWGDYVFIAGCDVDKQNRVLAAFDRRTGRKRWEQVVLHCPLETRHILNSYASSTPATDGECVYVSFLKVDGRTIPAPNVGTPRPITPGVMVVAAYDFDGKEKWRASPGPFISAHGYCSNPVLFEDLVIVNGDHDGEAYIVALHRETGQVVWKTPRENRTRSYSTPIVREIDGQMQLILSGNKCVAGYDPRSGSRLWIVDGPTEQFVASVVDNAGLIFVTGGFPDKHVLAVDPTGRGNVTDTHVRWRHERTGVSYVPSPVAAGDQFYLASDNGIGTCFAAKTGEILWQQRLGRHYSGSLLATRDHVYLLDDDGVTRVIAVGPEYRPISTNELGEAVFSSPAASGGQIFVRGEKHLWCVGKPE